MGSINRTPLPGLDDDDTRLRGNQYEEDQKIYGDFPLSWLMNWSGPVERIDRNDEKRERKREREREGERGREREI